MIESGCTMLPTLVSKITFSWKKGLSLHSENGSFQNVTFLNVNCNELVTLTSAAPLNQAKKADNSNINSASTIFGKKSIFRKICTNTHYFSLLSQTDERFIRLQNNFCLENLGEIS